MKATVKRSLLKEGLGIAERATSKSSSLPILEYILFSAKGSSLEISSTNLELGIRYRIPAHVEEEGDVVVPARSLTQFVSLLVEENIVLSVRKEGLVLKGEGYQTSVRTLSAEEFPIIPSPTGDEQEFRADAKTLCAGIAQVAGFAGQSQARPELSGVAFFVEDSSLRIAATDVFRLAERVLTFRERTGASLSFILPQKTAREVAAVFGERDGSVVLAVSPSQITISHGGSEEGPGASIHIVSRLIEGEFPAYREIIPSSFPTTITVSRQELLVQLRAASIFSGKTNEVRLSADPAGRKLEVRSKSAETGEHSSRISAAGEGEPAEGSFNWKFLLEGISSMQAEDVEIGLSGSEGPAVFRPKEGGGFLYVIMPLRS